MLLCSCTKTATQISGNWAKWKLKSEGARKKISAAHRMWVNPSDPCSFLHGQQPNYSNYSFNRGETTLAAKARYRYLPGLT
jgi:hypothetical protein